MQPAPAPALSATSTRLVELLRPHTPFAESIVRRQAERVGQGLATLGEADLAVVAPMIATAAATFVDPATLKDLKRSLGLQR